MKTSNCKTVKFPRIRRVTLYLCAVVVLCLFNLVDIKAEGSSSENTTTNFQPEILFRNVIDAFSFRLDAWISSMANKRLDSSGYYDGMEREFRGFGAVEQWDTEHFDEFAKSEDAE